MKLATKAGIAVLALTMAMGAGASAKKTKITFSCWGNQNIFDGIKERIKVFERQNPDIQVDFRVGGVGKPYLEQLTTWIAGGSGPDVFEVEYYAFWKFAEWGVLQDLAGYIKSDRNVDMKDFYDVCVDAGRYQGRQYGLPYDVSAVWVTYNKDLFSQVGLPSPIQMYQQGTWDWNTFKEAALKCTKRTGKTVDRIGLAMNWPEYLQMGLIWGTGGSFFNQDKTKSYFASPQSIEAARFMTDMAVKDGSAQRTNEAVDTHGRYLPQGKYGMYIGWTTMPSFLTANKVKYKYDMVPMPKGPKGDAISSQIHSISVLKSSKNKAAAWKFAQFLTGKDGYAYAIKDTYFSSTRTSLDKLYQDYSAKKGIEGIRFYPEAMRRTKLYELSPRFNDIQAAFNSAMWPVWAGNAQVVQSLQKVEKQANEMLADYSRRKNKK